MPVHEHELSRKANDGSRDDMQDNGYDEEGHPSRDQRAPTRTTFFESDIERLDVSKRRKQQLKRSLRRQEGEDYKETYSEDRDNREQQNREEWKRRMVQTYSAQLELTPSQKERVEHIILDVVSIDSFGNYSTEKVILGVINVIAREDGRWIEDETIFRDYAEQVGVTNDEGNADLEGLKTLRRMVRERIPSK